MAVGNMYTSQYGNTPQGQGVQNMANTLASITGSPAAGAYLAASQAGPDYSNTFVPQGMSEEEKLRTMFANDQVLAQKYTNPGLYGGTPTPNPAGEFASPLQATVDSITNPQGITNSGALIGAVGGDVTGQKETLANIMDAMNFNQTRSLDAYKSMLSALGTIYGEEQANKRAEEDRKVEREKIAASDETKLTSAEKAVVNATKTALDSIKQIRDLGELKTGIIQGSITKLTKKKAGTAAYNKELSDLDSKLGPLKLAVMNALIGTQMSKPEIEMVQKWIPDITQDPALFKQNLDNLESFLNNRLVSFSAGTLLPDTKTVSNNVSTSYPKLKDPTTGKVYEYDSVSDPDYINDLNSGFKPQ
jgi:hypothetical protein